MALKYTNIYQPKALQNLPNLEFLSSNPVFAISTVGDEISSSFVPRRQLPWPQGVNVYNDHYVCQPAHSIRIKICQFSEKHYIL
jgi:hypothetical protein